MERYIIAIDPGNIESAYVVMTDDKGIVEKGKVENLVLLAILYRLRTEYTNPDLYIEMVSSYGMPVGKEVFETVFWIGKFHGLWCYMTETEPTLVYRKDIKMHHCGSTRAKDSNIIQALKDKYGDKGIKANPGFFYGVNSDVWQAIALATYIFETNK